MKGEYPYYGASGIIDYVNEYLFDEEIILLGEDGENIVSRNLPLAFRVSGKCWINNHAHVIKNNKSVNIDFLTYVLELTNYTIYNTGTAQPKLNQEVCRSIPLYFPPLPEQQKIASFLSAIDEKIQQLKRKKELLEQYKKGVMQQLFSGKLRFEDENGKEYPKWEEKRLGNVCNIKGRIGYRGYTVQDIVKNGKGAITLSPSNITDGKLDFSNSTYISWFKYEESPEIKIEVNDTLLVKTGSSFGKSAFVSKLIEPATINPQLVILKDSILFPQYLAYAIYHSTIQKQIIATVGSGAVPNLSQESISNFLLSVPCMDEQQKIATYLSSIDTKIEGINNQIIQTHTFKKGLLQQMFV
jgi:type I restriction enzyme S subunit